MKKSLLAVAALGAFASAAQAQSSVTVYGILDVGYVGTNERVSSNALSSIGGNYKKTTNSFGGVGAESTSRLGFSLCQMRRCESTSTGLPVTTGLPSSPRMLRA